MTDRPIPFVGAMVRGILREIERPGTGKTQTRRALDAASDEPPAFVLDGCVTALDPNDRPYRWPRTHAVGDRLWVRETWRTPASLDDFSPSQIAEQCREAGYLGPWCPRITIADGLTHQWSEEDGFRDDEPAGRHRAARHMPRWASRLTLFVTDVRVQRLQEISEADAIAEGVERQEPDLDDWEWYRSWAEETGNALLDHEGLSPVWLAPGTKQGYGPRAHEPQWGPTPEFAFRLLWDSLNARRGHSWSTNPWVVAYTFRPILGNIDKLEVRA